MRISDWSSDVCSSDLVTPSAKRNVSMSERDRSIEEGIAAFRKTEEANLRKCGWVKRHVFPTTKQPGIDFSYTIGLTEKFGAPELIMTDRKSTRLNSSH